MPFLLVTGHPASGKSTIVERIQEYFLSKGREVVIVRDDDYPSFSRDDYGNSVKEKEQRSFLRSCVQKSLTQNNVVICDGLNYIKGYRYELFLIGKLCKTTFAVIYCHAEESVCKCPEEAPDDMHLDLEHPSPKFVDIPLSEIFSWMCEGKALTQNQSTQVVPTAPINFLHEIDRVTQEVTSEIIQGQRNAVVGHHIVVTAFDPDPNKVIVKRPRTLAELTRLRRQFISMSKSSPIDSKSKIASLFIHYLNTNG
ncbi:Chromatin associated protein KTI12 [Trichostrongylus colubriformis]|uniref:Protein KTI12 homolog n=1 Tax=Trichostrongylus colubriformis TaxID=6319 RepID=A0AAN8FA19_TRICO